MTYNIIQVAVFGVVCFVVGAWLTLSVMYESSEFSGPSTVSIGKGNVAIFPDDEQTATLGIYDKRKP